MGQPSQKEWLNLWTEPPRPNTQKQGKITQKKKVLKCLYLHFNTSCGPAWA